MKTIVYLAITLISTSCSTINYFGNGQLKKVRVDKSSVVAQVSNQKIYHDSLEEINNFIEIQKLDPIILTEVPNKSSKTCLQIIQNQDLNKKTGNSSRQTKNCSLSQKRFKTASSNNKADLNIKHEKSYNNRNYNGFDAVGKALLMVLITIGGILLLLVLIWVFTAFTEIALLVLGYILVIAMIIFVIGFPIVVIIELVRGGDIDGKWFTLWLSVLGVLLGGIALFKK